MVLRFKNTSAVKKHFGILNSFGAFANNEAIKNNPKLLDYLSDRSKRVRFKKLQAMNFKPKLTQEGCSTKKADATTQMPTQPKDLAKIGKEDDVTNIATDAVQKSEAIDSEQSALSSKWQSLEKRRYYHMYVQPTLFGGWSLVKSWGTIDSFLGSYKISLFNSIKEVYNEIEKSKKRRKIRGYKEVSDYSKNNREKI